MRTALAIQLVDVYGMRVPIHIYDSLFLEISIIVFCGEVQFLTEQGGLEHHRGTYVPVFFALCLAVHYNVS